MFTELLKETSEMWNIRIAAFCLIPKHFHMLVQTPEANISRSMRHLNGVYTQRYNSRHKRDGQLFRGRYKSILIDTAGYLLQAVTLGFGFTGYLLPWDQRAYWATTVGSESAGAVPVIGQYLLLMLRGSQDVSAATLSRFYGVHTLLLPLTLGGMLAIHLLLMHQQGLANPRRKEPRSLSLADGERDQETEKSLPFFPHYVLGEAIAWYFILGVLIILASLFPSGLEEPANPLQTPPHIKPEWYFLSLYQLLKKVPRVVGVLAPMVAFPLLLFLPFIDRNQAIRPGQRKLVITIGIVTLAAIGGLTIWGWLS